MQIEKLVIPPDIGDSRNVDVITAGNVVNIKYMSKKNKKATVLKLSADEMLILSTGVVVNVQHSENRSESISSMKKTISKLRDKINANVSDPLKLRWVTLTYRQEDGEPMTDTKKLYKDAEKYHKRLNYYCSKRGIDRPEYIEVVEPQASGAWHLHELLIWDKEAPYISNADLAEIWGNGFVTIKAIPRNCDNIGAYLTPYLTDLEIDPNTKDFDALKGENIKEVELDDNGEKVLKKFVKGARLHFYPPGMNLYRCSRGIKQPTKETMSYEEALKKVSGATKTYESAFKISEDNFESIIYNAYYNKVRKEIK